MSAPLIPGQAIAWLRDHPDTFRMPEVLRLPARQIDANARPTKLAVSYSGPTTEKVWSSDVIKAMTASGEDARIIDSRQRISLCNRAISMMRWLKPNGLNGFCPLVDGTYGGHA